MGPTLTDNRHGLIANAVVTTAHVPESAANCDGVCERTELDS